MKSSMSSFRLIDISRIIRSVGEIWLIQKTDSGLLFRASIAGRQARVLVQLPGSSASTLAPDNLAPLHVVRDLTTLESWLNGLLPDTQLADQSRAKS